MSKQPQVQAPRAGIAAARVQQQQQASHDASPSSVPISSSVCVEDIFTQADHEASIGDDDLQLEGDRVLAGAVMPPALQLIDATAAGEAYFTIAGNQVYDQGPLLNATDTSSLVYAACTLREWHMAHVDSAAVEAAAAAAAEDNKYPSLGALGGPAITWSKDFVFDMRTDRTRHKISMAEIVRTFCEFEMVSAEAYERFQALGEIIAVARRDRRQLEEQQRQDLTTPPSTVTTSPSEQMARLSMIAEKDNEIIETSAEQAQIIKRRVRPIELVMAPILSVDGVRKSLLYNGPVVITLPLHDVNAKGGCFWAPPPAAAAAPASETKRRPRGAAASAASAVTSRPAVAPAAAGGALHSVAIIGFTDQHSCFLIRNSWGSKWNGNGHAWMPYSVIESRQYSELWTVFRDQHTSVARALVATLTQSSSTVLSKTEQQAQWSRKLPQHQRIVPKFVSTGPTSNDGADASKRGVAPQTLARATASASATRLVRPLATTSPPAAVTSGSSSNRRAPFMGNIVSRTNSSPSTTAIVFPKTRTQPTQLAAGAAATTAAPAVPLRTPLIVQLVSALMSSAAPAP